MAIEKTFVLPRVEAVCAAFAYWSETLGTNEINRAVSIKVLATEENGFPTHILVTTEIGSKLQFRVK